MQLLWQDSVGGLMLGDTCRWVSQIYRGGRAWLCRKSFTNGGGYMWLPVPVLLSLLQHLLAWLICSAVVARGIQGMALAWCDPAVGDRACAPQ